MSLKYKLLLGLLLLCLTFGGGFWMGFHTDRGDVDPQDHIQTVFTPYDDGIGSYLSFLDRAHSSIYIADYSFTDPRIADKLIELKKTRKGLHIHVLLDESQTLGRSADYEMAVIERLRAAGIEVLIGDSEKKHAIMHSKYTIVDELWVESGSWNYTKSANDQDNTLDFIKSPKRAALFLKNWKRMHAFMKQEEARKNSPAPKKKGR
jgi:phosphatidylserine/phosphatidylglycerophosphate/cardiolipin synthase-like enzyme